MSCHSHLNNDMAGCRGSEPDNESHVSEYSADLSGWTNCQDSESNQKRFQIFHNIIENQCLDQLRTIVTSGWNVNEELNGYNPLIYAILHSKTYDNVLKNVEFLLKHGANPNAAHRVDLVRFGEFISVLRPVLYEAARLGWTELVKMLLEAGARCNTSDGLQNPLALALQTCDCQPDLIELLLQHGADPNGHDDQPDNIPLVVAVKYGSHGNRKMIIEYGSQGNRVEILVQLLLKHGANPNATYREDIGECGEVKWVQRTALHEAARVGFTEVVKILLEAGATYDTFENPLALALQADDCPPDLIEVLLKHGADLNYVWTADGNVKTVDGVNEPGHLLHRLTRYTFCGHYMFLQQQLDLVFLHGGNINMENGEHRTALECVVKDGGHINSVRWLIRHGADTALKFTLLKRYSMPPQILLQAGMRVSHGVQTQLSNMEEAISTWQEETEDPFENDDYLDDRHLRRTIRDIWNELAKAEEEELQRVQYNLKKSSFPEYWTRQMVDLHEFSDESLQVYPEDTDISSIETIRQRYEHMLYQIQRVLQFLRQPKLLQWHCRRSIRESLVSLQPSVVKKLSGPAHLKRYILCHEI